MQKVLSDYNGTNGGLGMSPSIPKVSIAAGLSFLCLELICYVWLNRFIFVHNSEMRRRKVITDQTFRNRLVFGHTDFWSHCLWSH